MTELDRNKSAYKLQNFGPVYCINLDDQEDRWEYMENQFKYWEVTDYHRISAHDGRDDDLSDILTGRYPTNMLTGEIGCTTSHLRAMKHFLETSDSPYAIMMEDDCDLDIVGSGTLPGQICMHSFHMIGMWFNLQSSAQEIYMSNFTRDL